MSTWTHINGCIRVDGVPGLGMPGDTVYSMRRILGDEVKFGVDAREVDNPLPTGSEGSFSYEIITAGGGLVMWTIPIWGDLRDYDDVDAIKAWFKGVIHSGVLIRSAILEVEVEGQTPLVFTENVK